MVGHLTDKALARKATPTVSGQRSRRSRSAQKRSAFASPAAKGYTALPKRAPHQSKPNRAPTPPPKTADRGSRTESLRRQPCRSRCSNEDAASAEPAEAAACPPTDDGDAERADCHGAITNPTPKRAAMTTAATVRYNRQGSGAQSRRC